MARGFSLFLKTSNPGSRDYQDQTLESTGRPLYETIAQTIRDFGGDLMGESGYSSVGAVIGDTFPEDARRLRALLPQAIILVTGYGAQGASSEGAAACFNSDGLGAIVNSSRGITYAFGNENVSKEMFVRSVRENMLRMRDEIAAALNRLVARVGGWLRLYRERLQNGHRAVESIQINRSSDARCFSFARVLPKAPGIPRLGDSGCCSVRIMGEPTP